MALIACPECGQIISGRARACPHCGFGRRSLLGRLIRLVLILFGLFTLSAFVSGIVSGVRRGAERAQRKRPEAGGGSSP